MTSKRLVYIWTYTIDPACREEFLAAYKPDGDWAQLFHRDPAYLGTRLLNDADDAERFVTIDYWTSRSARDAFRSRCREAFDKLDRRCEAFTENETFVGDFIEVDSGSH